MKNLSLTEFVDIASATGTQKITKIRNAKKKPAYDPAADFYRALRQGIIEIHKTGGSRKDLNAILTKLSDRKKRTNYPPAIDGYRKWWGHKALDWFEPQRADWSAHGVSVSINPELGLDVNGSPHLIKLYFKGDPLSKAKAEITLHLMDRALTGKAAAGTKVAILDVRRSKLITGSPTNPVLPIALDAELAFIATAWSGV